MIKFNLKLRKLLQILAYAKFNFKLPKKKQTIVLDINNSYYFINLFNRKKTLFLNTRIYESNFKFPKEKIFHDEINLTIVVYSIFKRLLNTKYSLTQHYIINYIKILDPKNIVSFTDNNIFFLSLKKIFNNKNLIIFQYAWRSSITLNDMYSEIKRKNISKKFKVDYTCVWGESSKLFYSKFVNTKYLITGSIKNNFFKSKKKLEKKSLIFISQFRKHFDLNKKTLQFKNHNYKDKAIKNIYLYCKKNNLKFIVLGCAKENSKIEKNYFNNLLGRNNFIFLERKTGLSSYKYSIKYKYFITLASSLGYELLSSGKRVAFLPLHYQSIKNNKKREFKESFYSNKKPSGPIWTNTNTEKEISRVINYILTTKEKTWKNMLKLLIDPLVIYDHENKQTKKLFKKLQIN